LIGSLSPPPPPLWPSSPVLHGCTAPSNAVPTPGFTGALGTGVAGLRPLCSPGSQVKNSVEQACLRVADAERVLWEVMAMVGRGVPFANLSGSCTPGTTTTHKTRYDRFPLAANGGGTIHPILDMTPPLLAEEKGLLP
jgi:hypothetical protein